MIQTIFTIIGGLLLVYFLIVAFAFVLKMTTVLSLMGLGFLVKSGQITTSQWWAAMIQIPFLVLEGVLIYNEGGEGLIWSTVLQILVSALIFNIQRIRTKTY